MSKNNKAKSAPVSPLSAALLLAMNAVNNLPPAPVFDESEIRKGFASVIASGYMTEAQADSFVKNARNKHEEKHGDTQGQGVQAVIDALLGVEGITAESLIKAVKEGRITRKARKELTDEDKAKVKALYIAGGEAGQRSVLADKFDVSLGTINALTNGLTRAAGSSTHMHPAASATA